MSVDSELCPIVHFLFDDCTSTFRHQAERIAGEINRRPAVLPEWQMKFFAKLPEWILGIELEREIFVSGKSHRHKSAANVQRSTRLRKATARQALNVQRSIHALNTQLSIINRFLAVA